MAFPESLTKEVKRRAHFQCCLCKSIGIEIHHIIPSAEGGPDTFDNAAPLCPSCHETYGANATKRKLIRQARDLWYEICDKRYAPDSSLLTEIRDAVSATASRQDMANLRKEMVEALRSFALPKSGISISIPRNPQDGSKQSLTLSDFAVMIYGLSSERTESQVGILVIREMWPLKNGLRSIYNEFLKNFGIVTLKRLASRALDHDKVPLRVGLTEEEIDRALDIMSIEAVCLNEIIKGRLSASLREDGEVIWSASDSQESAL